MNVQPAASLHETPFHRLLDEVGDGLEHAAGLLAGPRGIRLVEDIRETLQNAPEPDRRTLRNLIALHRILALDLVDSLGSEEEARFALIDPSDPVIEELCLLKDRFDDALNAYADQDVLVALANAA